MESKTDLKKIAKELSKVKGNVRGEGILTDIEYLRYKKGDEGVQILEEKLKELGYPIKFKDVRPMKWYPVGLDALKILTMKEIFNWSDKEIFEMANFAAKVSLLIKIMVKYFLSAEKSFKQSPKYWRQNYDFGELEAYKFNKKEKYMIFRIRGFKIHSILCIVCAGYFLKVAQFVLKSNVVTVKETKCAFKNADFHEFVINWE
jgi:hypothetical protein